MSLFQELLIDGPPPIPPSYPVTTFQANTAHAAVATRQVSVEPSVAGADRAMSWSGWFHPGNWNTNSTRFFCVGVNSPFSQQYALFLNSKSVATDNQVLRFSLFTDASNSIYAQVPGGKFLTNRWYHIVITYSGNEANTGIEIYVNKVQQAVQRGGTGTYTGALNSANNRLMLGRQDAITSTYNGDMLGFAVWNKVLTQSKVDELFNNGIPKDVDTTSFYATDIVGYWPMKSTITCVNNAALNFVTGGGITWRTIPLSHTYEGFTVFNGLPGNTRYVAFGGGYSLANGEFTVNTRSGTDHLLGGKIVKMKMHRIGLVVDAPIDIITDANDIRGGSTGVIDNFISFLTSTETVWPTFVSFRGYDSTDGKVGQTFGAPYSFTPVRPMYLFYGKVIDGFAPGEYLVPSYEMTILGANSYATTINLWKRDAVGTWTKTLVFNQDDGSLMLDETTFIKVNDTTLLGLARCEFGFPGLYAIVSTDSGATFSAPVATGMGTGVCMADMCLDAFGRIVVMYGDRGNGYLMMSHGNRVVDVLADLTDWVTPIGIIESYSTDSPNILGYPVIISEGFYLYATWSFEFSSTRADPWFGFGLLGWGV